MIPVWISLRHNILQWKLGVLSFCNMIAHSLLKKKDCPFFSYYCLMLKKKKIIMLSTCSEGWTIVLRLVQLHIYGIWCLTFMHFPSYAWRFLMLLSTLSGYFLLYIVNVYYVMGFRPNYFTCIAHLYLYYTLLVPHTYASYIRHWCIFSH